MVTASPEDRCAVAKARRLSPSSSGVSPAATTTMPVRSATGSASQATRTACPVPSWVSWTASTASGTSDSMCAPTCSRWWPTTATIRVGSRAAAACRTCPIMLRPAIGCSTFVVFDLIRVPPPAARTITVTSLDTLTPRTAARHSSPGRSRTYVASPDSKSGGPCRQTNRGMSTQAIGAPRSPCKAVLWRLNTGCAGAVAPQHRTRCPADFRGAVAIRGRHGTCAHAITPLYKGWPYAHPVSATISAATRSGASIEGQ